MNNFYKCAEGVDVVPLMMALKANAHLWNQNTLRTDHPETAHSQVDDIVGGTPADLLFVFT